MHITPLMCGHRHVHMFFCTILALCALLQIDCSTSFMHIAISISFFLLAFFSLTLCFQQLLIKLRKGSRTQLVQHLLRRMLSAIQPMTKTPTVVETKTMRNKKESGQAFQVTKIESETETGLALHYRQVVDINRLANMRQLSQTRHSTHMFSLHLNLMSLEHIKFPVQLTCWDTH